MALLDVYHAYEGAGFFLKRVAGACLEAAGDIRVEDPGTSNHANRIIWMNEVHADALIKGRDMLPRILDNATVALNPEAATDNDIQFVVNSLINEFATG
jgi:hypothetical protein